MTGDTEEAVEAEERLDPRRMAYFLPTGRAWNPLREWPRNEPCWCGTGKKAKKCHLPITPDTMDPKDATAIAGAMKLGERGRLGIIAAFTKHAVEITEERSKAKAKPLLTVATGETEDAVEREDKPHAPDA